jgi:polyvinyl alcohol dehydrogenase (cytochrome)
MSVRRARRLTLTVTALALAGGTVAGCGSGGPARRHHAAKPTTTTTTTTNTTTTAAAPPAAAEWTTYGGSSARASADTAEGLLPAAPNAAWTSPRLDGAVFGEPLVFGGQVFVGTENDTVYALSARDGSVQWADHLGAAVPASALPCGNISPSVGITSTMVVDPSTRTLFVSAETWDGSVHHVLVAIDLASHSARWSRGLDQPGWSSSAQLQRAGLALDAGQVLVGFGGNYGDCGSYHGWLLAVPESGTGAMRSYEVPAANGGAIWGPPGPAIDDTGDIFVATGNGSASHGQTFDHGNAVVELSSALAETAYFAPANWAQDNATDADLGSTSPVLLGGGLLFIVGKETTGYLLHRASLGGVGGPATAVSLCNSRGATAASGSQLFVVCPDDGTVDEVTVTGSGGLNRGWTWTSPTGGAGSPTVARGLLWAVDPGAATLYGVDPGSGATRYRLPLGTGAPSHFAGVSAGEGLLVVAGASAVEAFH